MSIAEYWKRLPDLDDGERDGFRRASDVNLVTGIRRVMDGEETRIGADRAARRGFGPAP